VVISSDLSRAAHSAKLAWGDTGIPLLQDSRIRECNYGDLNGKLSEVVEPLQEDVKTRFPNGENYEDVEIRIKDFLNYLKENFDGKTVAIVAHKAPQLVLDHILKGWSWEECFERDWRKTKSWQAGWEYELK
jgi:broad specificity phosphatase PhoE